MNISQYRLGKDLRDMIPGISDQTALLLDIACGTLPPHQNEPGFIKDAFYMDGTPVNPDVNTVYPCYAFRYTGTPVPEAALRVEESFSRGAAKAAISRTLALHGGTIGHQDTLNGLAFEVDICGTPIRVCFPICQVVHTNGSIVIPVADTFRNDESWGQGAIPVYVEQCARFLLWCYRHYHDNWSNGIEIPRKAYVARIIGNLPTDVTLFAVQESELKDAKAAERVLLAVKKALDGSKDPMANLRTIQEKPWQERKEEELEGAYHVDDPALYDLVRRYMAARSERKTLEAQDKALKEEADAIAVALGSLTGGDVKEGALRANGYVYRVTHVRARASTPNITTGLIYQFLPEYASKVVMDMEGKVTVNIDVA